MKYIFAHFALKVEAYAQLQGSSGIIEELAGGTGGQVGCANRYSDHDRDGRIKMEVKICARCLSTEKTQIFSQNLSNIECIFDLKKILEPIISVAALDQNVYYKTRLLDDRKTLSSLYVGEEDSFVVEFKAQCNMQALIHVFDRMKKFLEVVDEEARQVCFYKPEIFNELHDCYDDLVDCFEICGYELFIPWNNQASIANRRFFMQEGGLDMLLAIYKFSRKQIKSQEYHKDSEKENIMMFYEHQNVLEYMCLLTLWNYSELKQDRRMVLQKIGLDMFLESLIRDPDSDGQIHLINEAAIGCLAQYIEMADVQQTVADNVEAITKLISQSSHSTAVYHNEVAANTVFCCSNHPKAAMQMILNQTYLLVIQTLKPLPPLSDNEQELEENGLSTAVRYYLCLYLANIQTLPEEKRLSNEEKNDIDVIMENFLTLHIPSEIGAYEMSHDYVWITLAPFVQLALSCLELPVQQSTEMMYQSDLSSVNETVCSICGVDQCNDKHMMCSFSVPAKLGLFSLCHLTKTQGNQELFKRGKLVDYLVCICWFAKRCHIINSLVPELSGFGQLEPPRLQSIAKAYLAKCYGEKINLES